MLDIQPSLLVFEIITFLALVAILNQILYKPMLGFMEERNSNLQADAGLADAQESEKEAITAEANRVLADAKAEAAKIRHEAVTAAKSEAEGKINAVKDRAKADISNYSTELEAQEAELKSVIMSNAASYKQSLAKALKI